VDTTSRASSSSGPDDGFGTLPGVITSRGNRGDERRADVTSAGDLNAAAVGLADRFHDRRAQAGPASVFIAPEISAGEGVEHPGNEVR
jgi:hypothetical protein